MHTNIIAHSQGAVAAPGAKVALTVRGLLVNKTVILAPWGARVAYDKVEQDLEVPAQLLEANTTSVYAAGKGPMDYLATATGTGPVGEKEISQSPGHMGKVILKTYNHQSVMRGKAKFH